MKNNILLFAVLLLIIAAAFLLFAKKENISIFKEDKSFRSVFNKEDKFRPIRSLEDVRIDDSPFDYKGASRGYPQFLVINGQDVRKFI